jgi:simple sugar transport system permease protein
VRTLLAVLVDVQLWRLVLVMAAPLMLAAIGELLMERSGILNVAIEGMMAVGAVLAFVVTFRTQSFLAGVAAAMLGAAVLAALLAWYAVTRRASQLTAGLALFILGLGLASLIYRVSIGIRLTPPRVPTLPPLAIPWLGDLPLLGELLFRHTVLVYAAGGLALLASLVLFRTPLGLRVRATGENPRAVDVLGVSVAGIRYGAAVAGGLCIGAAGAYLPLALTGTFSEGMVGGRGWIALMLVIFGRWSPGPACLGALLFATVEALEIRIGILTKVIPSQFLLMLPYLFAIVVLVRITQGAQAPRALGVPYHRESRT